MSPIKRILIFAVLIAAIVIAVFYLTGSKNSPGGSTGTQSAAGQVSAIENPDSEKFALPVYPGSSVAFDGSAANAQFMGKKFKTATYSTSDSIKDVLTFYREAIGANLSEGKARFAGEDNTILSDKTSSRSFAIVNLSEGKTKIQLIDQI